MKRVFSMVCAAIICAFTITGCANNSENAAITRKHGRTTTTTTTSTTSTTQQEVTPAAEQESSSAMEDDNAKSEKDTVTFYISAKEAYENSDLFTDDYADNLGSKGKIVKEAEFEIEDGETAYELLKKVTDENGIELDFTSIEQSGLGYSLVNSINGLPDMACGDNSGWYFMINGKSVTKDCETYELKADDVISFEFLVG